MTDARFPERWLNDRRVVRLSDAAYRLFTVSLTWSVANRTDGQLQREDLTLMHSVDKSASDELAGCGLWQPDGDGWVIEQFVETQTTRRELEVLDNLRKREREKKRRQRARERDGPGDGPGGLERTGRTGQEGQAGHAGSVSDMSYDDTCGVCGTPIDPGAWYANTGRHPACTYHTDHPARIGQAGYRKEATS